MFDSLSFLLIGLGGVSFAILITAVLVWALRGGRGGQRSPRTMELNPASIKHFKSASIMKECETRYLYGISLKDSSLPLGVQEYLRQSPVDWRPSRQSLTITPVSLAPHSWLQKTIIKNTSLMSQEPLSSDPTEQIITTIFKEQDAMSTTMPDLLGSMGRTLRG